MDSRTKILTAVEARRLDGQSLAIVTGYFDILRAGHVRELAEVRNRTGVAALLAIVFPAPSCLLPQTARAELAAALRMVDYVLAADQDDASALIEFLQPCELARLEADDERRTRQLIEYVHRRQAR